MSCVNRDDIPMEKQVWFYFINVNWHICTSLDFVISRAKSSENLNKMLWKLLSHLDNTTLNELNIIKRRATDILKTFGK